VSDFFGKDRRGLSILFSQETWNHAVKRGHFAPAGTYAIVMNAFANTTLILDNPPHDAALLQGPQRVAEERYISWVPEWNQFLIVPVIVKTEPVSRPGRATLEAPLRIAATAMLDGLGW
jgi:hypothetical protein